MGVVGPTTRANEPILCEEPGVKISTDLAARRGQVENLEGAHALFAVQEQRKDAPAEERRAGDDERAGEALRVDRVLRDGEEADCERRRKDGWRGAVRLVLRCEREGEGERTHCRS